jgi:hypothetical protein
LLAKLHQTLLLLGIKLLTLLCHPLVRLRRSWASSVCCDTFTNSCPYSPDSALLCRLLLLLLLLRGLLLLRLSLGALLLLLLRGLLSLGTLLWRGLLLSLDALLWLRGLLSLLLRFLLVLLVLLLRVGRCAHSHCRHRTDGNRHQHSVQRICFHS